jgi:hypothetical protein
MASILSAEKILPHPELALRESEAHVEGRNPVDAALAPRGKSS